MRKEDLRDMALLVATIRTIFKLVRVMPFIYALSYIAAITVHAIGPTYASSAADLLFYVSPLTVAFNVSLSLRLHFCGWHLTECLLPLIPFLLTFADTFFVIEADHMHISAMMLIALISISTLAAINVFGRHHKKRAS